MGPPLFFIQDELNSKIIKEVYLWSIILKHS